MPRQILRLLSLVLLSCASVAALPVHGAERPLVLAFDELPPWKTQNGTSYSGAYTEIVRELARRVGLPLVIAACPLKRCLYMLESGDADIIIGVRSTPERARYLQFLSTPYRNSSSDKVFYVLDAKAPPLRNYADLKNLRIGVKLGAEYFAPFDTDKTLKKDSAKDADINLRKLALGRLDAVLVPEDQGEALLTRLDLRRVVSKAPYREADPTPRAVALARKSPHAARLADFEQAMAGMARDGTLAQLIRRHYYDAYKIPLESVQIR